MVKVGKSQKQSSLNPAQTESRKNKSPLTWLLLFVFLIAGLTAIGPAEKTLGINARVVYLHGVWVWAALASFFAAAVFSLWGWIRKSIAAHIWSRAMEIGRASCRERV